MSKIFILLAIVVAIAGGICASPLSFYSVSPNGTFLEQSPLDNCSFGSAVPSCTSAMFLPTVIPVGTGSLNGVQGLGVTAGDMIGIQAVGTLCYAPGSCGYSPMFAVEFVSGTGLLGSTVFQRAGSNLVPYTTGGINGGVVAAPNETIFNSTNAQQGSGGPSDFLVTSFLGVVDVTIPVGTQYIMVGVIDSFYADNSAGPGNFGVLITGPAPEPATWTLIAAGLGCVSLFRRKIERKG